MKCFTVADQVTRGIIIQDEPVLRIGAEGYCSKIPLCQSLQRSFEALKAIGEDKLAMQRADLQRSESKVSIVPEKERKTRWGRPIESDIALVHVTTTSSGQLWLEANCYDEKIESTRYGNRIRRAYRPFPGGGLDIVAIGTGANGEPNALLRMLPGSSFRICRDDLNLPPELLVVWPGTKLRLIVPEKYRKHQRREKSHTRRD